MERLPFDHRADGDRRVDIRALQEALDRERNLEHARNPDDRRDPNPALFGPGQGLLHHDVRDLAVELRRHDREPHGRVPWSGPASANPSR